jgi:hypothetical protein
MWGQDYETDEVIQHIVRAWLRGTETDFYRNCTLKPMQR